MPVRRKRNKRPQLLRVLVEILIEAGAAATGTGGSIILESGAGSVADGGVFIPVIEEFRTGHEVCTTSTRLGDGDLVEVECMTQLDWWDSRDPVEFQLVPYSDGRPAGRLRAKMARPVRGAREKYQFLQWFRSPARHRERP